jgi:hypothetical protein
MWMLRLVIVFMSVLALEAQLPPEVRKTFFEFTQSVPIPSLAPQLTPLSFETVNDLSGFTAINYTEADRRNFLNIFYKYIAGFGIEVADGLDQSVGITLLNLRYNSLRGKWTLSRSLVGKQPSNLKLGSLQFRLVQSSESRKHVAVADATAIMARTPHYEEAFL